MRDKDTVHVYIQRKERELNQREINLLARTVTVLLIIMAIAAPLVMRCAYYQKWVPMENARGGQ